VLPLDSEWRPRPGSAAALSAGLHSIVEGPVVRGARRVYLSNRLLSAIHVVDVSEDHGTLQVLVQDSIAIGQVTSSGDYFRGLASSADRRTLYAAFRSPASLVILDIAERAEVRLRGLVPLHGSPAGVAVDWTPAGERVYVSDFSGDSVYCVDPDALEVLDRIPVASGPYGIVISQSPHRAFVTSFEDHQVLAIDLDEQSPTWHQVIGKVP